MTDVYIALDDRREYNLAEEVYGDPDDLFLRSNVWRMRKHTNVDLVKAAEAKDVDRYVRIAGGLDQALLRIIAENDTVKFPEGKIILFVTELLRRGARVNCTDTKGDTPLHLSAVRGFLELARELRKWGAEPNVLNSNRHTPMEIAIHLGLSGVEEVVGIYNSYAAFIIKEMEPSRVRECFIADSNQSARLSFHALLNHSDMKETVQAVLDCLIERVPGRKTTYTVYYSMLEADKKGRVSPTKSRLALKRTTAFEEIAWKSNKEAVTHLSLLLLIQSKWRRFARTSFIIHFFYWILLMTSLTCALVLAASQKDPTVYDQPVDVFRGICEGLSVLLLALATLSELYLVFLWRQQYFKEFNFFFFNYLNIFTIIFVTVLIILRVTNNDVQWVFASLAYVSYALRVFKYILAMPLLSKYVQILYHILVRDLVPFLFVSFIVIFIFTGAFYFALRGELLQTVPVVPGCSHQSLTDLVNMAGLSLSEMNQELGVNQTFGTSLDINPEETGTFPRIFLTGIRLLAERQNFLTYFGENGFHVLGVLTYLLFLFTIQVVLLSLLIAQMSDTYSTVQEDAQRALIINQARNIISIERTGFSTLRCITDFFVNEETWKNPKSHVQKINRKSLDSIDVNTKLMRGVINQHSLLLEELRDALAEQKTSLNLKFDKLMEQLTA